MSAVLVKQPPDSEADFIPISVLPINSTFESHMSLRNQRFLEKSDHRNARKSFLSDQKTQALYLFLLPKNFHRLDKHDSILLSCISEPNWHIYTH